MPDDIENRFDELINGLTKSIVVLCIGPIGSGKTSFSNELSKISSQFVAIDGDLVLGKSPISENQVNPARGDQLDLGIESTLKLGKERNEYSRWKILEVIMSGKIPVMSTGGGVLFSSDKWGGFLLRDQIYSTLGFVTKIIVCISGKFSTVVPLDRRYDVNLSYNNNDAVKKAVIRRVETGEWKLDSKFTKNGTSNEILDNFASEIAQKSNENAKFAKKLVMDADLVYGYPAISQENFGIQKKFNFINILENIPMKMIKPNPIGNFSQIRILTMINNEMIRHITWKYDMVNKIVFSTDDFNKLSNLYKSTINGKIVKIYSADKKNTYTFAIPDALEKMPTQQAITEFDNVNLLLPESIHITIDSGIHAPKETSTIMKALANKQQTVKLPTKDNKFIEYNLSNCSNVPCKIRILGVFGI